MTGAHSASRRAGRPPLAWRKRKPTYAKRYAQIRRVYAPSSNIRTSSANIHGTRKLTNRATITTTMHSSCKSDQHTRAWGEGGTYGEDLEGETL